MRQSVEIIDEHGLIWMVYSQDYEHYDVMQSEATGYLLMDTILRDYPLDSGDIYQTNIDFCLDMINDIDENNVSDVEKERAESEIVHAVRAQVYLAKLKRLVENKTANLHRRSGNKTTRGNKRKVTETDSVNAG